MKKRIVIALLASVVVVATISGYVIVKKHDKPTSIKLFTVEKPIYRPLTQYINASGNLKAKDQISIGSLVAGRVVEIKADDNDQVKKDQVLAILDNGIGETAVKRLEATLDEAQAIFDYQEKFYKRQTALYNSGQISDNLYDQYTQDYLATKARVEQARYALKLEQQTYNNLFIKSPDHGIVIAKRIDLGQMITSVLQATVLYEIAPDLTKMEAYIDVDEADIGMVKDGQDAIFTVDAFPKKHFTAKVDRIQYLAKIVDGVVTYATILKVENPKFRLRPGMTTNVDIKVAENKRALTVPNKTLRINTATIEQQALRAGYTLQKFAIPHDQQKDSLSKSKVRKHRDLIWILEDKVIKQVEVKLGTNDGRYSEILNGINENTNVISEVEEIKTENKLLKSIFASPVGG
ncbi:efflux RND transporter periplasmic adaptor subunit [Candidatus Dependentiae bacterium]|nr:efflux RND transporter periplasmic adaptor subunit [Candidatus Dependentiae bacterium]